MIDWMNRHPNIATWAVLSVGMVAALAWSARGVEELALRQWAWLVTATVLVAGLCAWIISWEADDPGWEDGDDAAPARPVEEVEEVKPDADAS